MIKMNLEQLREKLNDPNISRQRRWQIRRILDGKCEICGGKREEGREQLTRCETCEKLRHERQQKKERAEKRKEKRLLAAIQGTTGKGTSGSAGGKVTRRGRTSRG